MEAIKKITDVATALNVFERAAIKHEDATNEGDSKSANKNADKILEAVKFLKQADQIRLLLNFSKHTSHGVRCWAATYLLPVEESVAINILEELAKGDGFIAFDAETVLTEWRSGNLNHVFDY